MRATKKIIALVMAIAMISTCGVSTAFANVNAADSDTSKPNPTEYSITVTGAENATVTIKVGDANVTKVEAGKTVAVTVTAKTGFGLEGVTTTGVKAEGGLNADGTAYTGTFTMPANNVSFAVTTRVVKPGTLYINKTQSTNGTFVTTVNGKETIEAKKDDVVTVVATPAGTNVYELDAITCKTTAGATVTVTDGKFTMPNSSVTVTVTFKKIVIQPSEINPATDVTVSSTTGITAGGKKIESVTKGDAKPEEANKINDVMADKLRAAGLQAADWTAAFTPIDISILDANGNALKGTLNKPINVTIKISTPGFTPKMNEMRIMHNHNGTVEIIRLTALKATSLGEYSITFPMSKFSTVMPVMVEAKGTSGGSSSSGSYSGGSSGGGGGATESSFDGSKMRLTGGETVSAATVEAIAGTDKVYTVNYRGKDYTFNGKNVAKPGKGVIYYSAEEFMKLVQGKLVSATGSTSNDTGNPDTGANDFAGLAMALAMVSLAGIAACNVAKKK